ncbi:MAG: pyridoxamine 5'-phosphate oxidase family protein [Limisphaerales bacterium]|nr:pyridoxamine 5-phosphate oxidase [Pedosphaera sp.]MBL6844889.1 pyridoxamine 5'-phosphate oxidase family protein [Verrucomicrobiae bacterium]RZO67540.1 MAG: pyridoxamine 5-phosphate oxidase [Limisphaerales bacterium]HBP55081.1 pyridoxamine 5-phosphate oxidase [Verrucomicrobiales bacterium]HCZ03804.1 pyridoxamine 5-phosphate oxidase [Verrucomicrobiales bacterium]|tara:strand:- start:160 stop:609 length:450 start_codon:yes stop_codon:yes gene_type:complete
MDLPELPPMEDAELIELAQSTMHDAKFPFLSSVDGDQARVRPVSPVRLDHFTVYVANLKFYKKTEEIAINPKVELCYMAGNHDQVRITGIAELVDDRGTMIEIWDSNPLLRKYLGSVDNPQLIIYRIIPNQVRYMKEWALEYYDVKFSV